MDPKQTGGTIGEAPDFMSTVYENGLKVIPSYANSLRGRYDTLLANTKRRRKRLLEGKARRDELDDLLDAFNLKLSELEEICDKLGDSREIAPEKIQARMEAVQVRGSITYEPLTSSLPLLLLLDTSIPAFLCVH